LKICKLTPFPGSDLGRRFSGTHYDLLNKTIKPFDGIFWGFNPILTRLIIGDVIYKCRTCTYLDAKKVLRKYSPLRNKKTELVYYRPTGRSGHVRQKACVRSAATPLLMGEAMAVATRVCGCTKRCRRTTNDRRRDDRNPICKRLTRS